MNEQDITNSIGYCGLVCALCHNAKLCEGCKTNHCSCRHNSKEGCYQYQCCQRKGINGCWECDDAPCDMDMFSSQHNIRNRAFIRFAKYEGIEELGKCVFINQMNGIKYGYGKDYDQFETESDVVTLLTQHYINKD